MPPLNRRDLIKGGIAASLVPLLTGCADGRDSAAGSPSNPSEPGSPGTPSNPSGPTAAAAATFDHGVASGDPLPTAVILWTRATPIATEGAAVAVSWRIARDQALMDIVASGTAMATGDRDYTVKVDATGLAPAQTYYYDFASGSTHSQVGRTKTAPVGDLANLRMAFVTCSKYSAGYYNVYSRIAARDDIQAVVHLGDYIYESSSQDDVRTQVPTHNLVTLDDYRLRYSLQHQDPDLQAMHRQHPMIWVWDDHEVANDAWKGGAGGHDPATEGEYATRRAMGFRAAHEWVPIRTPHLDDLTRIYRPFAFGNLVDLIMIDARHVGRDAPIAPNIALSDDLSVFTQTGDFADTTREILGTEQDDWFAAQLAASTAKWRVIGNQVIFAPLKLEGTPRALGTSLFISNDKWDGYEPARDRALELLAKSGNIVIMTGDAHEAYAFDITPDPNNPAAYNPLTGAGSYGVEFVVTSTTTRGDDEPIDSPSAAVTAGGRDALKLLPAMNPHLKYFENERNGYILLDITSARTRAEFWFVPSVGTRGTDEELGTTFICNDGSSVLTQA